MARNAEGLKQAIAEVQALKKEFWSDVRIPGEINEMNPELDKANRVADFIECFADGVTIHHHVHEQRGDGHGQHADAKNRLRMFAEEGLQRLSEIN